jgi:DNA-binding MarR family transcriptional regulator
MLSIIKNFPLTVRSIAEALGFTVDATNGSMRRMEDNGWVRRITNHSGANKWELTEKGRELIAR